MKILFRILLVLACVFLTAVIFFAIVFRDRRPPVYFAAETGDTNYIGQYLALGSNVNAGVLAYPFGGNRYKPLLHIAAYNRQLNTVDYLLKKGANPNTNSSTTTVSVSN